MRPGQDTPGSPRTAGVSVCLWWTLDSAVSVPAPDVLGDGQGVCLPGRWSEPDVLGDGHGVWLGSWPSAPFPVPDESACVVRPYARLGGVVYAKAYETDGNTPKMRTVRIL